MSLAQYIRNDFAAMTTAMEDTLAASIGELSKVAAKGNMVRTAAVAASIGDQSADLAATKLWTAALDRHMASGAASPQVVNLALADVMRQLMESGAFLLGETPSIATTIFRAANVDALSRLALTVRGIMADAASNIANGMSIQDGYAKARAAMRALIDSAEKAADLADAS